MKALLVAECRQGRLAAGWAELAGFAGTMGATAAMVLVGTPDDLPGFDGPLYFADIRESGAYNPELHRNLVLEAVEAEHPELVVFLHTSYGWDLAPRITAALRSAQVSAVSGIDGGGFVTPCCNGKMRRTVTPTTPRAVLTIQPGAFAPAQRGGVPQLRPLAASAAPAIRHLGTRPASMEGIDLTHAPVVVSAGRGVGRRENVGLVRELAAVLGGEVGASRPVVDAGWLEHGRQVGSTGQEVSPELYVACGVSGAVQHLAGMKGSGFVLAVNTDRDAPIGEVADLLVVADLVEFLPALAARFKQ